MGETSKPRELTYTGQPFYDRAVYVEISRPLQSAAIIQRAFPDPIVSEELVEPSCILELPQPMRASVAASYERLAPIMEQRGFERVKLKWVKPGPDGTLVPRRAKA